ncbi:MAG: DUF4249 domain-containing protein [Flavobacteriales bacterium]|nr:DUF4249 domain-containing protein [Flavobacteriales bacterium]
MKKYYYILGFIIILASSCTEIIEFDVGESDPILAVDAEITTERKAHRVKLNYSTSVFDDENPPLVTGASVIIEDDVHLHILTEVEPGIYETLDTVRGYEGRDYNLTILADDNTYTATETLKPVGEIECAFLLKGDTSSLFFGDEYIVLMSAQEPEGLGDYYLWNYYEDGVLISDTIGEKFYGDDEFVDGTNFNGVLVVLIDTEKVDPVNKTMMLEMKSISEGYYDYLLALQLEKFRGSPFDGPPANPPTNLSNGAVGFFRATDVSQKNMCVVFFNENGEPNIDLIIQTCDFGCADAIEDLFGQ